MLAVKSANQSPHFTGFRDFTEGVSVVSFLVSRAAIHAAAVQLKSSSRSLRLSAGGATA